MAPLDQLIVDGARIAECRYAQSQANLAADLADADELGEPDDESIIDLFPMLPDHPGWQAHLRATTALLADWLSQGLPLPEAVLFCYQWRIELLYRTVNKADSSKFAQARLSQLATASPLWRVGQWTDAYAVTVQDVTLPADLLHLFPPGHPYQ